MYLLQNLDKYTLDSYIESSLMTFNDDLSILNGMCKRNTPCTNLRTREFNTKLNVKKKASKVSINKLSLEIQERRRVKNRLAARRCRQKQREIIDTLEKVIMIFHC